MRLHYAATSPYVRKVMVLLHEVGREDEVEIVVSKAAPVNAPDAPVSHNPLGKVPTLERADGPALYDSRVITRFLNDWSDAGLYPEAPRIWETLTLEATADGILDSALSMVYEVRFRTEALQDAAWMDGQWDKIARACDALETRWMSHLHGRLDMGGIAVGCALGYLDLRLDHRAWRTSRPSLAAWFEAFGERPSMVATAPPA